MRPGQNKRMRGRPNNNGGGHRKGPNPLTRSYESNGPDVKVRGNAHHVAEKYLQLARDAQSSGDPVAAESYLQHAEHYFRLIASAQAAQAGYARQPDAVDADGEDEDDSGLPDRFASPQPAAPFVPQPAPTQQQPYGERQPYNNGAGEGRQPYADRQVNGERPQFNGYNRADRNGQDRGQRRPFEDRQNGGEQRPFNDRQSRRERYAQERNGYDRPFDRTQERQRDGGERYREATEAPRDPHAGEQPRVAFAERAPDSFAEAPPRAEAPAPAREAPPIEEAPGLPSFITAPARAAPPEAPAAPEPAPVAAAGFPGDDAEEAPKYPRRRRRAPRAAAEPGDAPAPDAPPPASDD